MAKRFKDELDEWNESGSITEEDIEQPASESEEWHDPGDAPQTLGDAIDMPNISEEAVTEDDKNAARENLLRDFDNARVWEYRDDLHDLTDSLLKREIDHDTAEQKYFKLGTDYLSKTRNIAAPYIKSGKLSQHETSILRGDYEERYGLNFAQNSFLGWLEHARLREDPTVQNFRSFVRQNIEEYTKKIKNIHVKLKSGEITPGIAKEENIQLNRGYEIKVREKKSELGLKSIEWDKLSGGYLDNFVNYARTEDRLLTYSIIAAIDKERQATQSISEEKQRSAEIKESPEETPPEIVSEEPTPSIKEQYASYLEEAKQEYTGKINDIRAKLNAGQITPDKANEKWQEGIGAYQSQIDEKATELGIAPQDADNLNRGSLSNIDVTEKLAVEIQTAQQRGRQGAQPTQKDDDFVTKINKAEAEYNKTIGKIQKDYRSYTLTHSEASLAMSIAKTQLIQDRAKILNDANRKGIDVSQYTAIDGYIGNRQNTKQTQQQPQQQTQRQTQSTTLNNTAKSTFGKTTLKTGAKGFGLALLESALYATARLNPITSALVIAIKGASLYKSSKRQMEAKGKILERADKTKLGIKSGGIAIVHLMSSMSIPTALIRTGYQTIENISKEKQKTGQAQTAGAR